MTVRGGGIEEPAGERGELPAIRLTLPARLPVDQAHARELLQVAAGRRRRIARDLDDLGRIEWLEGVEQGRQHGPTLGRHRVLGDAEDGEVVGLRDLGGIAEHRQPAGERGELLGQPPRAFGLGDVLELASGAPDDPASRARGKRR
jgi:hypothetical protein